MERNTSYTEGRRVSIRCFLSRGHEEVGGKPNGPGKVNIVRNQVEVILSARGKDAVA
jgi:hypothetical protein